MFDLLFAALAVMVVCRIVQFFIKKPNKFLLQFEGLFILSSLSTFIYMVIK